MVVIASLLLLLKSTSDEKVVHNEECDTQAKETKRVIPLWVFRLLLLCSFVSCYSLSNYVPLLMLICISQHESLTDRKRNAIFAVLASFFLLQSPCTRTITYRMTVTDMLGFFSDADSPLSTLFLLFGKNTTTSGSGLLFILSQFFFALAMACLPLVREETPAPTEAIPVANEPQSTPTDWLFLLLSKYVLPPRSHLDLSSTASIT